MDIAQLSPNTAPVSSDLRMPVAENHATRVFRATNLVETVACASCNASVKVCRVTSLQPRCNWRQRSSYTSPRS